MSRIDVQRRSVPWPKWLFWIAAVWITVNFFVIITFQGQLSRLIEPNPLQNSVDADVPNMEPASTSSTRTAPFSFDKKIAENALQLHGRDVIFQPLRAYIEKSLNDTVPGTIDKGNLNDKRPKIDVGRPAKWYVPLQLREGTPDEVSP
jgi:hypothetical protein